jgi:two-component system, NarL family, nitrate/nitrite response regulator NarL
MRVILVGSASARARLRAQLIGAGIEVAAEFASAAVARASAVPADAIVTQTDPDGSDEFGDTLGADDLHEPLTPREVDVIELLAEGLPNKAIADRLGISDQTVKFHVASIYGKLGAANRTDAVRRAARRGLIAL